MLYFRIQQNSKALKNIRTSILISAIIVLIYSGFTSCKKIQDPEEYRGEKDTITYDLLKTSIHIQFIDAATKASVIPENGEELRVKVVGNSSIFIADIMGIQKPEYFARHGVITFGLVPGMDFTPSPESPVSITVIAQLKDYITTAKDVTITSEGDYMMKILMVNEMNPPSGVILEQQNSAGNLVCGTLLEEVSVRTQNSEAIVIIPKGARLLDSDSVELAGKIDVTLTYHNTIDDNALAVFTGGITGTVIENKGVNDGIFFPTGLLTINIVDKDLKVASIIECNSVEIYMKMNEQAYNPKSGSHIIAGDSVPLYVHLSSAGLWKLDQFVCIKDNLLDGLYAHVKTKGLHSFHFSWFEKNNCNQRSTFKLAGNCTYYESIALNGVVRKQVDNSFVSNISLAAQWDESINIPFSTGSTPVYIEWEQVSEQNYCVVDPSTGSLFIDDMCSNQLIDLPLIDDGPQSMSITANFIGTCPSDTNIVILPSFGVWVRQVDAVTWRWSSMKNGVSQIYNVLPGNTYVFGTYYNGTWKEWEVEITEETSYTFEIDFDYSACKSIFGML